MEITAFESIKPLHSAADLAWRREAAKRAVRRKRQRLVACVSGLTFLLLGTAAAFAASEESAPARGYETKTLPTFRLDLKRAATDPKPVRHAPKRATRATSRRAAPIAATASHACPFGSSYRSAFEYASRETGVSLGLLSAVAMTESRIDQSRSSEAGATGVMQLTRPTAAALGVNPDNAWENIVGGARYLAEMLDQFSEVDLALAAYNAGPGAVAEHHGVPPYTETLNYIYRVRGHLASFAGCV